MEEIGIDTPRGRFAARARGEAGRPLALLLHGFPDDAATFDALAADLAAAGYRAVAPYLRGCHPSPLDGSLALGDLASDLLAQVDALSPSRPIALVGHDYGSQIAYVAMTRAPDRFAAAVTLAGAHPAIINRNMRRLPRQWWASRYIIFLQFGRLADRGLARRDFAYVDRLWRRWSPGFAPPPGHLTRVKETLRRSMPAPAAMYRAGGFDVPEEVVQVPTLFIAGARDGCLLPAVAEGQQRLFPAGYGSMLWDGVGHFPHLERPTETSAAVREWIGQYLSMNS